MTKKQVAGYSLERRIGKGSYATVWKGRDDRNEHVAVKAWQPVLSEKLFGCQFHAEVISRQTVTETAQLRQEVEVLRKISHPNIVRFRDLKKSAAHFYLVLEYCAGGDLSIFLREKGRVQEETARRFLTQIAEGLSVLHQVNVLHRDLKPQNILLSDSSMDPVLKIADFGFARALPPQDMAATVCGSPLYMAPEILRHEPYDAKADLWSVGAILFELLMGRTPFSGANPMQLLANIEKSPEISFEGVQLSNEGQEFLGALLVSPGQRLSSQAFMQHPYVRLSSTALTPVASVTDESPSPPSIVGNQEMASEGSFIMTDWVSDPKECLPKSGAASPVLASPVSCHSPEESPRDAVEAHGGFVTASSSASGQGDAAPGENNEPIKKVEELSASEAARPHSETRGMSGGSGPSNADTMTGKVSPFMAQVIAEACRDRPKESGADTRDEAPAAPNYFRIRRNGSVDEEYVVVTSNTPTSFARGKGPTPAAAASGFCSNLSRIARALEQLAMRLVEHAPLEALSLLLRALALLEKALKVSLDDEQMGAPLRSDFSRTLASAEEVEKQLKAAISTESAAAQPNRAIFESAVQYAKDAAVVLSKGHEAGGWEAACHEKLTLALLLLELLGSEAEGEDVPAIAGYTAPIAQLAAEIERRLKGQTGAASRSGSKT
ncbi:ATG1B [Symbiodinium pilosum]|uniref:ATG1B protein n=1 Tax=Symbiodinium pilosum TaxID=2952 RepID=A0A812QQE5_SYMPI|nr:ATG1B [Symbiodinium pilosum]